jgi:lysophospholipid acyltransferase (LPLAT)-like uncharacterized protein
MSSENERYQPKHSFKIRFGAWAGSLLVWLIIQLWFRSCRIKVFGRDVWDRQMKENNNKALGAGWHRGLFYIAYHFRNLDGAIMSSRSKDGELFTSLLKRFGHITPRGSSGKDKGGKQALAEFVELVNQGRPGGLATDAPKGPPYISKHGVVAAAAATGAPIVPFGWYAESNIRFNSWDRTMIPKPFSRLVAVYDREPIIVPTDADREQLESYRQLLDERLNRLAYQTDRWFELKDKYDDPRDIPVPEPVPEPYHPPKKPKKKK